MFSADQYLQQKFADCVRDSDDLHDDQIEAVEWLKPRPFSALFIDVGLGKTAIILTLLDWLFWIAGYRGKVLIIAPIRVATRVWPREPRLWRHLTYLRSALIRITDDDPRLKAAHDRAYKRSRDKGYDPAMATKIAVRTATKKKENLRTALLDDPAPIHIINQEAVEWLVNKCADRGSWPYKIVIFDESSRLRDYNSNIFAALKRVLHKIERFHQLTATPAPQTYMNFFSQIYMLDKGERFGRFITKFRKTYFDHNPYTRTYTLLDGAAEAIEAKISDICFVLRKKREAVVRVRPITLPPDVMTQYDDFERTYLLGLPEGTIIDAVNGGALSTKLLQLASGAVYDEFGKYHVLHDEKIDELRELAEETLDEPILVAYWFKSSLARLRQAFPKAVVMDREGAMEVPWNQRKHKMMLVHPRSVGHGLNLQQGGHHLCIFDVFWPLELFLQLIGRLDRQGQQNTVICHLLSATGTLDEVVTSKLQYLESAQEAMFRRLRELHRRLHKRNLEHAHQ